MKFFKFIPALLAAAALSLCACGGEEPDGNDGNGGNGGNGPVNPSNLEEVKERVADIASSVLDRFKPDDQKELIQLVNYLSNVYGDVYFEGADSEAENGENIPYAPMRRLSRSYENIIDIVNGFPKGVYTPVDGKWTKTGPSNDVVLSIPNDPSYGRVELTVKQTGTQNVDVNVPDDALYKVTAPTNVEGTLTAGGKTMVTEKLSAKLNTATKTLVVSETTTAANVVKTVNINATNTQATANTTVTLGGSQFASAIATLYGHNLCDVDKIAQAVDNENIESFFTNATVSGNVIGQLFVNGNIKAFGDVMRDYYSYFNYSSDDYYGDYKYDTAQEASDACDEAVARLNRNVSASVSFSQGGSTIANLTFIKDGEDYSYESYEGGIISYGDYYAVGALKFSDGTTYTDEFFEYGFETVISKFDALISAYERLVD